MAGRNENEIKRQMDGPGHTAIFSRLDSLIRSLVRASFSENKLFHIQLSPGERWCVVARLQEERRVFVPTGGAALIDLRAAPLQLQQQRQRPRRRQAARISLTYYRCAKCLCPPARWSSPSKQPERQNQLSEKEPIIENYSFCNVILVICLYLTMYSFYFLSLSFFSFHSRLYQ